MVETCRLLVTDATGPKGRCQDVEVFIVGSCGRRITPESTVSFRIVETRVSSEHDIDAVISTTAVPIVHGGSCPPMIA